MYVLQFQSGGDFVLTRDDARRLLHGETFQINHARDHSRYIIVGGGWQLVCPPHADITTILPSPFQC